MEWKTGRSLSAAVVLVLLFVAAGALQRQVALSSVPSAEQRARYRASVGNGEKRLRERSNRAVKTERGAHSTKSSAAAPRAGRSVIGKTADGKGGDKLMKSREVATLGGGCFWCLEAVFDELRGVESVVSGYAGGTVAHPTYQQVCTGATGHAEVVHVTFDPSVISYRDLLSVFFTIHDPTTRNRQGADVGTQYRSIILYHSSAQKTAAEEVRKAITDQKLWGAPIVTEIVPLAVFYPAEEIHQEYYRRNPEQGYCRVVIEPKVVKFRKQFTNRLKEKR